MSWSVLQDIQANFQDVVANLQDVDANLQDVVSQFLVVRIRGKRALRSFAKCPSS